MPLDRIVENPVYADVEAILRELIKPFKLRPVWVNMFVGGLREVPPEEVIKSIQALSNHPVIDKYRIKK